MVWELAQYIFCNPIPSSLKCVIQNLELSYQQKKLIFSCHTLTHGIDLRRSPLVPEGMVRANF